MENKFILSCESTIDLTYDYAKSRDMHLIFYNMLIDDEAYEDNMDRDTNYNNKYCEILKSSSSIKTSQINQYKYEEYFQDLVNNTKQNILHICFGTGMTQSYSNAVEASNKINETLKDRKIYVVDSTCSCGGYGLFVDMIADLRDKNLTAQEAVDWAEENKYKIQHHFFSNDLNYFKKSGRLSGPSATIAGVLNIVPLMKLNKEGKMIAYNKVRGTKKAITNMVNIMKENALNGVNYNMKCFINHCYCLNDAIELSNRIKESFKNISEIKINNIGNIIASHCGPGTISLFYYGKERI